MINCRICNQNSLKKFLSLGPTPLANSMLSEKELDSPEETFPLDLCVCTSCNFVQLADVVPPQRLFRNYAYFTATSSSMTKHYHELAREVATLIAKGSLAVEFASNDGTLLKGFEGTGVKVLGVEPAKNIAEAANKDGIETIPEFFVPDVARQIVKEKGKAHAIIGTNVFAHIQDLHEAVDAVDILLDQDGVLVIESPYFVDMFNHLEFDTAYHEHVSYLTIRPLVKLFSMHGMRIADVKRQPVHGGSIRLFVKKGAHGPVTQTVTELIALEEQMGLDSLDAYFEFARKVQELKFKLVSLIAKLKLEGHTIAAYGAAAKGNTLLNYCGIGAESLDFVSDASPHKIGLYTPGRRIPILAPSAIMEKKPDFVLILAWNLSAEIMVNLSKYSESGGKFIIPVPEPKIV